MASRHASSTKIALVLLFSCLLPCCLPCFIPTFWRIGKELAQRKRDEMPPKLEKRKRKLSAPTQGGSILVASRIVTEAFQQRQSPLFRLPIEVRLMIYRELVQEERVWMSAAEGKLSCYRSSTIRHFRPATSLTSPKSGMNVIPLLQSCRKTYTEAIELLYSQTVFAFSNPRIFLSFAGSLLPCRLASIRNVELHFNDTTPPLFLPKKVRTLDCSLLSTFTYYFMHMQLLTNTPVRNPCLPAATAEDAMSWWHIICEVMSKMEGLRNVNVRISQLSMGWVDGGLEADWRRALLSPLEWTPGGSAMVVELWDDRHTDCSRRRMVWNTGLWKSWERYVVNNEFVWNLSDDSSFTE